ncbi:MAG: hypothetical protein ACHQT8_05650, partial [Chlamydiales bacterium]
KSRGSKDPLRGQERASRAAGRRNFSPIIVPRRAAAIVPAKPIVLLHSFFSLSFLRLREMSGFLYRKHSYQFL